MEGVSVICICKNRESQLRISLTSWLHFENIKEILIIDNYCDKPLKETLDNWFSEKKIRIIRLLEEVTFCEALNLAIRCANYNTILKMDTDYILCPLYPFFELNPLESGYFIAGEWQQARIENELFLNGLLYARKIDLLNINGYSEFIKTYGWDDSDIKERLIQFGLKHRKLNIDSVLHLRHPDISRQTRGNNKNTLAELVEANRVMCLSHPWTKSNEMCKFALNNKSVNYAIGKKKYD